MDAVGHDALERLIATRPPSHELWGLRRELEEPLAIEHWKAGDGLDWHLGPELSRTDTELLQLANYTSDYEGTFTVVLRIKPGVRVPGVGEGWCHLGTVIDSFDYYEYGASFAAIAGSGLRLSWTAATQLHAAACGALANDLLIDREVPPRHIRFGLFHRPYSDFEREAEPAAIVWLRGAPRDRAWIARAITPLVTHPDPAIDRLMHDEAGADVLRDLLLQRGRPIETLLRDLCGARELDVERLADDDAIDREFAALWQRVLALDPMIVS